MPDEEGIRALVVGQVTHDRYGSDLVPGGCAYYGAETLQALGARVSLATAVGRDFTCEASLAGLDVHKAVGEKTTVFLNEYPKDGPRIQWIESVAPAIIPDVAREWGLKPDILFIAPVFGEMSLGEWTQAFDARIVGVGLQGFLKMKGLPHPTVPGRHGVVRRPFRLEPGRKLHIDVVFLSEEDIAVFGDDSLLPALKETVPLVVMTRGEKGATIFENQRGIHIDAYPTDAVDPTGAGDTFSAAFLYALATHATPEQAGRLAAAAASIVIEGQGGEKLAEVSGAFERRKGDIKDRVIAVKSP
ncbi:MAG: sugar kinase [Proteobacteria bacterium]|nr:sugar kinase [Pseudomonadota bacterium]